VKLVHVTINLLQITLQLLQAVTKSEVSIVRSTETT